MKRPYSIPFSSIYPELEKLAKEIRKAMPGFETIDEVLSENTIRAAALRQVGKQPGNKICLNLADKLKNCYPDQPCESMACSLCQRYRRLKLLQKWLHFFEEHQDDYVLVTLIFYVDMFRDTDLQKWKLERLKERLRKKLKRIGITDLIIGGFEMDYHNYTHARELSRWMPHFHLLVPNEPEKLEQLREYMLRDKNQRVRKGKKNRPFRKDSITDPLQALSYCVTGLWQEYIWFLNEKNELKKAKNARRIQDTTTFAKSLVKLDRMSDALLTFRVNVQKLRGKIKH